MPYGYNQDAFSKLDEETKKSAMGADYKEAPSAENTYGYTPEAFTALSVEDRRKLMGITEPNTTSPLPVRYPSPEESYYKGQYETAQKFDPEAIKKEERARIQSQIDSINKYFQEVTMPQVQQEQTQNIGASRAIQSGAGLLETPMGQAQTTKTQEYNRRIMRSEEVARDEKINALFANADAAAQERITAERTLARQDTQAYFDFLKGQKADAVQNIKDLAAGGVSIDDIKKDSARYQTLLDATGMDDLTATAIFNANAPRTAAKDITYKTVGDKIIGYYYNDSTGKIETVESDSIPGLAGGQYKPQVMADGTLLMIPDTIDPTKSIDDQIIQYGGKGQWSKGTVRAGGVSGGAGTTAGIDYGTAADISGVTQLVDKTGKPIKLTATQVDTVTGFESALQQLQQAKDFIDTNKPNTGPIAGPLSEVTRLTRFGDSKIVQLDSLLSSLKANFMKAISGAAVSESEVKRLSKFLPSINDTEQTLQIKIKQFEDSLNMQKKAYLGTLGAQQTQPTSDPLGLGI